jgi:LemA protein
MSRSTLAGLLLLAGLVTVGLFVVGTYNRLVGLEQEVVASWAQVQNVYQRRADLVPNLVETVKGAAAFEQQTYVEVAEARSRVTRVSIEASEATLRDPAAFQRFVEAQSQLDGALSRLLVVAEAYPELKATEGFRDLQVQLEGTENRIAVERMRYGEAAQVFNTARLRFPAVLVADAFGERFAAKPYFSAPPAAQQAPSVRF